MRITPLHAWDVSTLEAMQIQQELADKVLLKDYVESPRYLAGVDVHQVDRKHMQAVVCVLKLPELAEVETSRAVVEVTFPYISGLLAFREGPAVVAAFEELQTTPDVILFDAQGLAHPRHLGLASQMGLWLDTPSIGCAKSLLYGKGEEVADEVGATSPLIDPRDGTVLGAILRTRKGVSPVYVSVGHKITLETALKVVLSCCRKYRIPEPLRMAHALAKQKEWAPQPAAQEKGNEQQGRLF